MIIACAACNASSPRSTAVEAASIASTRCALGAWLVRETFGPAEQRENPLSVAPGGCFRERARQIGDGAIGGTPGQCVAGGLGEQVDHPAIAAGAADEQMRGHPLRRHARTREHPRRVKLRTSALTRPDIRVDRGPHDRMRKHHRLRPNKDLRVGQPVHSRDHRLLVERADIGQVTHLACPPSTARVRATLTAVGERPAIRVNTERATLAGPCPATRDTCAALGSIPSARSARISSRR